MFIWNFFYNKALLGKVFLQKWENLVRWLRHFLNSDTSIKWWPRHIRNFRNRQRFRRRKSTHAEWKCGCISSLFWESIITSWIQVLKNPTFTITILIFMLRHSNKAYRTGNVGRSVGLQKKSNKISVTLWFLSGRGSGTLLIQLGVLSLAEQCHTKKFHLRCFKSDFDAVKSKFGLLI